MYQNEIKTILNNLSTIYINIKKYQVSKSEIPSLVIVTKKQSVELLKRIVPHIENPIFGENRVNELLPKIKALNETEHYHKIKWHFIGHLQTNKVKKIINKVVLIHSLDSLKLAREINKRAKKAEIIIPCLLQIDICQDGTKYGIPPADVVSFLKEIESFDNILIKGLMTIAPNIPAEETRPYFRTMKDLFYTLKKSPELPSNVEMEILSMGMSNDYIVALQEGSNMVRIGSAIFKRKPIR